MNEQDQRTTPAGRTFNVLAYGDTAEELELYALDCAREFFGEDVRLEVERDYSVQTVKGGGGDGKKYMGTVFVHTVE